MVLLLDGANQTVSNVIGLKPSDTHAAEKLCTLSAGEVCVHACELGKIGKS